MIAKDKAMLFADIALEADLEHWVAPAIPNNSVWMPTVSPDQSLKMASTIIRIINQQYRFDPIAISVIAEAFNLAETHPEGGLIFLFKDD